MGEHATFVFRCTWCRCPEPTIPFRWEGGRNTGFRTPVGGVPQARRLWDRRDLNRPGIFAKTGCSRELGCLLIVYPLVPVVLSQV
jgi:hypothetical protein